MRYVRTQGRDVVDDDDDDDDDNGDDKDEDRKGNPAVGVQRTNLVVQKRGKGSQGQSTGRCGWVYVAHMRSNCIYRRLTTDFADSQMYSGTVGGGCSQEPGH